MSFAWPLLLWLLVIPLGWLAWELTHRRRTARLTRPKILRAEAGANSLVLSSFATAPSSTTNRPRIWLCCGLILALFALARPQWGRIDEPVFDQSREILLAIDLSRSMLTPDVKPSRLERAKLLIQSLLEKLEGERVGLVVFSGTAFLQSPLSADYEILREFLPALGPEFLPAGGSNYRAMLETSLQAFGASTSADRFLIVLSDGEATEEDWKEPMAELKKKNIRVLGLGVGTTGGGMIPDGADGFIKDERGAVVLSKLESSTLQELARNTDGVYRDASTWVDVAGLLKETVEAGRKGEFVEKNTIRLVERFQWPLALALWCLLVSFYSEFPVRPRPRDIRLTPGTTSDKMKNHPATVAAIVLLFVMFCSGPSGFAAATLAPPRAAAAAAPEPSALSKLVGRLSVAEKPSGSDWAEFARETVTWGSRLQSEQQSVPEGPVRDALAAVDAGSTTDPRKADWPKLREELNALLKKPEEKKDDKKDEQKDDKSDQDQQNQDKKKQDQKKSDQSQDDKKDDQQKKQQSEKSEDQKNDPSQPKNQSDKPEDKPPGDSAFGDMQNKPPAPPPPPHDNMQKVGGAPERKDQPPPPTDPALALPLQKLDQLKNQDSPAQLFQLMEGERKTGPKKTGKDW